MALFTYREGKGHSSPPLLVPTPSSSLALLLVTEVLPSPAEGSRTAGHYQLLPEGARSLYSPKSYPPPPQETEGWPGEPPEQALTTQKRPPCLCSDQLCGSVNGPSVVFQLFIERFFWAGSSISICSLNALITLRPRMGQGLPEAPTECCGAEGTPLAQAGHRAGDLQCRDGPQSSVTLTEVLPRTQTCQRRARSQ